MCVTIPVDTVTIFQNVSDNRMGASFSAPLGNSVRISSNMQTALFGFSVLKSVGQCVSTILLLHLQFIKCKIYLSGLQTAFSFSYEYLASQKRMLYSMLSTITCSHLVTVLLVK